LQKLRNCSDPTTVCIAPLFSVLVHPGFELDEVG
jgi:hypothetical protein